MKEWKRNVALVVGLFVGILICGKHFSSVKAAQTYYVSYAKGSDSNVGTSKGEALKTLKKAVAKAAAGDAIRILDTVYVTDTLNISKEVIIGRAADMTDYMIVVESGAELTLRGSVVLNGRKASVKGDKGMIKVQKGGTLHVKGNAVLKNNHSRTLPGGAVHNLGTMTIAGNGAFENNETGIHGGGAIHNVGTLTIDGGVIRNNKSGTISSQSAEEQNGGGILNTGTVVMTDGIITENQSVTGGGGVHNSTGGTLQFSGGTISENTTGGRGGGISCYGGTLSMTGGVVSSNSALSGGGIQLSQDEAEEGVLSSTISGGKIVGNNSIKKEDSEGHGGGVLVRNNHRLTITGGEITKNTAEGHGGGIRVGANGEVILKNANISIGENAATNGGGIHIREKGILQVKSGGIENNQAKNGGAIYVNGECRITGGTIRGNDATKGAGVYHNGTLTMSGTLDIEKQEDVFLTSGKYVILPGGVNPSCDFIVLTPSDYTLGRVCTRTTKEGTKASAYQRQFALAENEPYVLRAGDYLCQEAQVMETDLIVSRAYTISYEPNVKQQVNNLPEADVMYWKETYMISDEIPEWSKQSKFEGWNEKADGSGVKYSPGETLMQPSKDLTLYAQWSNMPPEIHAENCYVIEDEIEKRVTKKWLKSYGSASDMEEGDLSERIQIINWEELMQKLNQPYSEAERNQLERHITVKYYVEDSLGAGAETQAELVIFLLGEEEQTAEGYVRFLDEEYIDGIDENTYWGSEDKKSLLREMMERDSAEITWEE